MLGSNIQHLRSTGVFPGLGVFGRQLSNASFVVKWNNAIGEVGIVTQGLPDEKTICRCARSGIDMKEILPAESKDWMRLVLLLQACRADLEKSILLSRTSARCKDCDPGGG